LNIVHLGKYYPPERGGIETVVCHLAEAGVHLGHSVHCLVSHSYSLFTKVERINSVSVERLGTLVKIMSTPFSFGFFFRSFKGVDIVHVHLPHPIAELRALSYLISRKYFKKFFQKRKAAKIIPFVHALPISQGWIGRLWFSKITTPLLNLSDRVLVSHPYQLKAFPELMRWKEKVQLLPYMVYFSTADIEEQALEKRKKSNLVLAIGRLVSYKGFSVLLKAWKIFQNENKENIKFKLKVIGEGPEYPLLKHCIVTHQMMDSVQLLGNVEDDEKFSLLGDALLFVAPSMTCAETFGLSILEAMSKGLPVITTRLPTGVAALARGGECGAVVTPGSVEELASALSQLLKAPEALTRMGYRNFLFANAHHSPPILLSQYESLLNSINETMNSRQDAEQQQAA
jgi:glycosyltransferase involved in cell wall biosynthesis